MKKEHIHTSILSLMQSPIENRKHDEEKLEKNLEKKRNKVKQMKKKNYTTKSKNIK